MNKQIYIVTIGCKKRLVEAHNIRSAITHVTQAVHTPHVRLATTRDMADMFFADKGMIVEQADE